MRTISEIYEAMIAEKNNQTALQDLAPSADSTQQLLQDLNSSSKVAIWRLFFYVVAVAIHIHEGFYDHFKSEVDAKAKEQITGNLPWYQNQILAFQYEDNLVYDEEALKFGYAAVDEAAKIVARCSVSEAVTGFLNVKVAKLVNSQLSGLDAAEQAALISYIKKIRLAGTRFTLFTGNGDDLRIPATIYYDPLVPLGTIKLYAKAAIEEYIENLPFNGQFQLIKLVDKLQSVSGIEDVVLGDLTTRPTPADPWGTIERAYNPRFGYFNIDSQPGYTLNDTLQYQSV